MNLPPIHFLEAFESVARLKSLTMAANELHVTPSAISHRISNLESRLGTALFHRDSKKIELTNDGLSYLNSIQLSLEQITSATDLLSRHHGREVIKLDCCQSFSRLWLLPKIKSYLDVHPNVLFQVGDIHVGEKTTPISNFQITRTPVCYEGVMLENLFKEHVIPLVAPEFIDLKPIKKYSEIINLPLIYSNNQKNWWPIWLNNFKIRAPNFDDMLGVNHPYLALEAAHQQLGVVIESVELSREYIAKKYLRPMLGEKFEVVMPGYQLTYRNSRSQKSYISEFREWLFEKAKLDPHII